MDLPFVEEMAPRTTPPHILITYPFTNSDKNYTVVPITEVEAFLKKVEGACERTNPTEHNPQNVYNRVYVDLDGEVNSDWTEEQFKITEKKIRAALQDDKFIGGGSGCLNSLCYSSKFQTMDTKGVYKNKLSYSIVFPRLHGDKTSIAYYVRNTVYPKLKELLKDIIEVKISEPGAALKKGAESTINCLLIDMSVYSLGGRKMRMVGQSKTAGRPGTTDITIRERRPKKIINGDVLMSLITYIPEDSVLLPKPIPITAVNISKPIDDTASVATNSTTNADFPLSLDTDDERREVLLQIITGLSVERFNHYPDWIRLGFAMFNEGLTCDDYIAVSKVSKHYKSTESPAWIRNKWNKFKKTRSGISQSTLWRWLSHDNAALYDELFSKRQDFWSLLKNPSHAETARFFYNLKPDAYLYNESLKWFQLMPNNTWKNFTSAPSMLKADIWNTIQAIALEHYSKLPKESDDEEELKRVKQQGKALYKFCYSIGSSGFVDGVIQFLPANYNNDDLPKLMDESRHLLAFTDEVYDLDLLATRKILPSDYVSINTGYAFPKFSDPEVRKEVLGTIRSIFERDEDILKSEEPGDMTKAALQSIATCLHGRNKWERFYVWTGRGGNGKSMLGDLVKKTLGDYYHPIPNSILTKAQDKRDATCGALYKAKGKRFVIASEPEAQDRLQVGIIKELTGGDEITVRDLYKSTITFTPQFGLFCLTNGIPLLNRADGGFQRRLRVFPFPFSFVSEPTQDHHKKINADLKDKAAKSNEWRDELMLLLIEAFADIKAAGKLCEPPEIIQASKDYMDENNPIKNWLSTNFETGLDPLNTQYMYGAAELLEMFLAETSYRIDAPKFKSCMMLCEVISKKESHNFTTQRYNPETDEHEPITLKAGQYWLGMKRKSAPKQNDIP